MPTPKESVQAMIQKLPDDVTYEEMLYKLYVLESIEAGMADVEAGRTFTHEQVKRRLAKWLDA
ncbi:MAG: hypothetical protein QNJ16_04345 [Rhodobacter sp.]|nr:hypothetical protein [Rhodobacter sp.]